MVAEVMRTIEPKERVPWPRILAWLASLSQKASCASSGWTHGEDHATEALDAPGSTGLYAHAAPSHRGHGSPVMGPCYGTLSATRGRRRRDRPAEPRH